MIDIYTVSVGDAFLSKWGKIMERPECKVHTKRMSFDYDIEVNPNGEAVVDAAQWSESGALVEDALNVHLLYDRAGKFDYGAGQYLEMVVSDNKKVLEHPNAIFVLDVSKKKANEISKYYGVICQPIKEMSVADLKDGYKVFMSPSSNIKSWGKCLKTNPNHGSKICSLIPANSLIIMDRYLFTASSPKTKVKINKEINYGIKNVVSILNSLVPRSFKDDFHILLMFDPKTIIDRYPSGASKQEIDAYNQALRVVCGTIADKIQKKVRFKTPKVFIEILCMERKSAEYYSETHDRRIISNYYIIKATKNLKAFKKGWVETQDVTYEALCNGIDNGNSRFQSALTYESHQHIINVIKEHLAESKEKGWFNRIYQNGKFNSHATIQNRLLK